MPYMFDTGCTQMTFVNRSICARCYSCSGDLAYYFLSRLFDVDCVLAYEWLRDVSIFTSVMSGPVCSWNTLPSLKCNVREYFIISPLFLAKLSSQIKKAVDLHVAGCE